MGTVTVTGPRTPPPSRWLSWLELSCRDGTPYPLNWRADRLPVLVAEFEALRERCGPLLINSAYRTHAYNARIGGAPSSQHCEGRALDLVPVRCSMDDLRAAIEERTRVGAIRGVGLYSGFTHVDVRPGATVARWGIGHE